MSSLNICKIEAVWASLSALTETGEDEGEGDGLGVDVGVGARTYI